MKSQLQSNGLKDIMIVQDHLSDIPTPLPAEYAKLKKQNYVSPEINVLLAWHITLFSSEGGGDGIAAQAQS